MLGSRGLVGSLESTTEQLLECVSHLNQFLRDCHGHCLHFAKELQRCCAGVEAKVQRAGGSLNPCVLEFGRTMQGLAANLEKQVGKNLISLKTIRTEKDGTLFAAFVERIRKMGGRLEKYEATSQQLAEAEAAYLKKAEEFADIETDAVKCYSGRYFAKRFVRVTGLQSQLQALLEQLKTEQSEIQLLSREARRLLNELVALELKKIRDMNRLARQVVAKMAFASDNIIIEEDERTVLSERANWDGSDEECAEHLARVRSNFHAEHVAREEFSHYLKAVLGLLGEHCRALLGQQGTCMDRNRLLVEECLGQRVYEEYVEAYTETFKYCLVLERVTKRIDKARTFEEYVSFQKANFDDYEKQFRQLLQREGKREARHRELRLLDERFAAKDGHFNERFRQELHNMLENTNQVLRASEAEYSAQAHHRQSQVSNSEVLRIYEHRLYAAFVHPFASSSGDYTFVPSKHVEAYVRLKTNYDNVSLELGPEEQPEPRPAERARAKWCGLARSTSVETIDEYNCALVYGILLQGKLHVQRRLLRFVSLFNRSTFIGKTEIEVPSRDILKVEGEHGAINYYIVVSTVHGEMRFTSFLHSPLGLLRSLYAKKAPPAEPQSPLYDPRSIYERAMDLLTQVHGFRCVRPDCFSKELTAECRCTVMLEHTINSLFLSFLYKFRQNEGVFENYSVRVIKPQLSQELLRCDVDENAGFRTMREHFLQIIKGLLEPYRLAQGPDTRERSCTLELSAIEGPGVVDNTHAHVQPQEQPKTSGVALSTNNISASTDQNEKVRAPADRQDELKRLRTLDRLVYASPASCLHSATPTPAVKPQKISPQLNIYCFLACVVLITIFLLL